MSETIIDKYLTIKAPSEGLFKDKGSKFLAFAYPVKSEEEITEIIKGLKKTYYDARHHCYAFRLGADMKHFRAADDGEPSNSAGQPIFNQIRSFNLTNVLVVVVRYFGGTKLGVPGLVNAYKTSAAEAFENAEIIEKTVDDTIEVYFEYPHMNDIMSILKDEDLKPFNQKFELDCSLQFSTRKTHTQRIVDKIDKIRGISVKILD